jgi:hypothetical protein
MDLTGYGFKVEARAPHVEGLMVQDVMQRVAREVFVGWAGKWEFDALRSASVGGIYGSHISSDLTVGNMVLWIGSYMLPEHYNVVIEMRRLNDDDMDRSWSIADVSEQHKLIEVLPRSIIDQRAVAEYRAAVMKASKDSKRLLSREGGERAKQILAIVERWKS